MERHISKKLRLNNLEELKIQHGQSSEVWEKLNKSLTFTRYLQESSNYCNSHCCNVLQKSWDDAQAVFLDCQPNSPWWQEFTTQHSKAAWVSCLPLYLHKAHVSSFPWLPWTLLFPLHSQGRLFAKTSSSGAEEVLHSLTLPVSIFSQLHTPSQGNFILCKAKCKILIIPEWPFLGVATPAPSLPVTLWKCLFWLLACYQITFLAQSHACCEFQFQVNQFSTKIKPFSIFTHWLKHQLRQFLKLHFLVLIEYMADLLKPITEKLKASIFWSRNNIFLDISYFSNFISVLEEVFLL